MIDKQLNIPECSKCKIKFQKGVPLVLVSGMTLCGNCLDEFKKKLEEDARRSFLQE